jgi:uncharacterized protein
MYYRTAFAAALIGVNVVSFLLLLWCLKPWIAIATHRRAFAWIATVFALLNLPLAVFFFTPLDALLMPFPVPWLEKLFLPSAAWVTALVMYSALGFLVAGIWTLIKLYRRLSPAIASPEPEAPIMGLERRKFIAGGLGLALPTFYGIAAHGLHGALDELQVSPVLSIPIKHLPAALDGLRVIHLSDIHVGPYLRRRELESLAARVNELRPDIIAITGDLIDRDIASLPETLAGLRPMRATTGIYAVTGNHDIYADPYSFDSRNRGAVLIAEGLSSIGINTLRDESVMVGEGANQLAVLGLDWLVQRRGTGNLFYNQPKTQEALQRIDKNLSPGTPKILLVHHPETFRDAPQFEIGLTLSGHTHGGGQIVLGDFRGTPIGITGLRFKYVRGLYQEGDFYTYVSRGIGYLGLPIRVNCPPEIAQFRLTKFS